MSDQIVVTVRLPRTIVDAIVELAARRGTTKTEILRRAVSHEYQFQVEHDDGGKILIERDGDFREVVFD